MASWTNTSVLEFSKGREPIAAMLEYAQRVVFEAIQSGWIGPPFDPIALADILKIDIVPSADVKDARTIPRGSGRRGFLIEFNPNRPRGRMRYSIAHEIAHTFFADCADRIRNRLSHSAAEADDWQLEMLCNIGAAEILMPVVSVRDDISEDISVEDVLQLSEKYDVSIEAILIRASHLSQQSMVVFVASDHTDSFQGAYTVDYSVPSRSWCSPIATGYRLPEDSVVSQCTAIGFTAKNRERWKNIPKPVEVEFVGLPPYPGSTKPRVAGLAKLIEQEYGVLATLEYLRGDALSPRGEGTRIIAHIVNDRTANWGGNGFAAAVKRKFPDVQREFRNWAMAEPTRLRLGEVHVSTIESEVISVQMIAQAGYGVSKRPRIRYQPLQKCLETVGELAIEKRATVHMPRIGMGYARGQWPVIEQLLYESLISRGVSTNVYDLPVRRNIDDEWKKQVPLRFE